MKGTTALHLACQAGSADLVKLLLEMNANPSVINSSAQAPIDCISQDHLAFKEIQALLFEYGDEV
jgi:ankyrin repeat protein